MIRPPIPASCAYRPTYGGFVAPYVNIRLADGATDFRSPHQSRLAECFTKRLCQTCGHPTGRPAVLFGGPNQVASGRFDEPPLCPPCAMYASHACPMVAGRQSHYAERASISEGNRGHVCPDAHCDCAGFVRTDPTDVDHGGEPAHPWYAVFIDPAAYVVTYQREEIHCSDGLCDELHPRVIVTGGQLTASPLKVVLISEPGIGRIWRRLAPEEVP